MSRGEPDALKAALSLLGRLFQGEKLTVKSASLDYPFREAAVRRHLKALAEVVPGVRREGVPDTWVFGPMEPSGSASFGWALAAARQLLSAFRESGIGVHLSELLDNHRRTVGGLPPTGDMSRMLFSVGRGVEDAILDAKVLDLALDAVVYSKTLEFSYWHFEGQEDSVCLEPYSFIVHESAIYLYGRCIDSDRENHVDRIRLYNMRRIRSLHRTGRTFLYPHREDYDPARLFYHCFGTFLPPEGSAPETVELAFPSTWSSFLGRHPLHRTQVGPTPIENGEVKVRIEVFLSYDLVRWVRGVGNEARVLQPVRLANWVSSGGGAKWTG